MTAVARPLAAGDPARYAALAATLALLTGALAVLAWLVRLGFVAALLSRPVLVGYLTGVALIMMAGQLGGLTGVRVTGERFFAQLTSFAGGMAQLHPGDLGDCRGGAGVPVHRAVPLAPAARAAGRRAAEHAGCAGVRPGTARRGAGGAYPPGGAGRTPRDVPE